MTRTRDLVTPYRIDNGADFRLQDHDTGRTPGVASKKEGKALLEEGVERMAELQDVLYAHDQWSLLLIFQAMDAAGKDSTIKHVMSGVNPQGCQVFSFKKPSAEELDHDFLWRTTRRMPERGRIGIFNRSYYEEVLVVRVHQGILEGQKLPASLVTDKIWEERYEDINNFERHMARSGTRILKFFLNVSRDEQKRRFLRRLNRPDKNWKFSSADVRERGFWNDYMHAYEEAIRHTATPHAPWFVVPADNKWYLRIVVGAAIVQALEDLDLAYPTVGPEQHKELAAARTELERE
jgi:PPK2 family polyphosphate:nucleotide phosphotransferase